LKDFAKKIFLVLFFVHCLLNLSGTCIFVQVMKNNQVLENANTQDLFSLELQQAGLQPVTWADRAVSVSKSVSKDAQQRDLFFRIRKDYTGDTLVDVVNLAGKPASADSWSQAGEVAAALRLMERIREERLMRFSWGDETEEDAIRLSQYPYLLLALIRCDNLVTEAMQPITVSEEAARVQVWLIGEEGKEKKEDEKTFLPIFAAKCSEDESGKPFEMLTDTFLLRGGYKHEDGTYEAAVIHPTLSLGENYRQLQIFKRPFPVLMTEQWIAVLFTYLTNVELLLEGRTVVWDREPLRQLPTVVIEKVDEDMALYLRLADTAGGVKTTCQASLANPQEVRLRPFERIDLAAEQEHLRSIIVRHAPSKKAARQVWQDEASGLFIVPEETAGPFLLHGLLDIVNHYRLLGAERLREYKVKPVRPRLNLSLGSGIDFLEGTATVNVEGEELTLADFLKQYQREHYILLSDGNRAIIDEGYVRRLERLFRKTNKGGRVKVSFFDLPDVEALLEQRLEGAVFDHHRRFYEGFNQLPQKRMRFTGVTATLRGYQREGVKWIDYLHENRLGGCLADDMGLGKTLQTITMLTRLYPKEQQPSLIVMPRSLLFNWQDELRKFAPQLTYYIYYGAQRDLDEACRSQLVLTTYALVRNDIEQLRQRPFHYVILDESQNVKNLASQSAQAVALLPCEHRLALSGTPIENNLTELYALFHFLNPAMFGSLDDFNQRYAYPIQRDGDREATESLRRRIFPFILRRLKGDVLDELPPLTEQTLYVEMDDDQRRLYEQRRQYYQEAVSSSIASQGLGGSQMMLFQALSELRRIASVPESLTDGAVTSPKLEPLSEAISEAVAGGHKVVVFFNFIAGIELVGEQLNAMGIDFVTMTGATHDRRSVVERFQGDPRCRALLMTLKTGGVGLNLTAADTVFIFEPWWNRAAEMQAISRLHRIGQNANVLSYAMIVRDTIEEKIRLLQQQKAELTDALISSDLAAKQLTEEDIRYILG